MFRQKRRLAVCRGCRQLSYGGALVESLYDYRCNRDIPISYLVKEQFEALCLHPHCDRYLEQIVMNQPLPKLNDMEKG